MRTVNIFENKVYFLPAVIGLLFFYQSVLPQSIGKDKKVIFSSRYTNLKKCRSGMTKAEERALAQSAMNEGDDQPLICVGYDNYEILTTSHGCRTQFQVRVRTKERVKEVVIMEELDQQDPIYQRKVEWRMANGKPFAVIFRRDVYDEADEPCQRKKTGEVIRVIGLANKKIDFTLNPVKTKIALSKSRQMADRSFSGQR